MDAKKRAGFGRKRAAKPGAVRSSEVKPVMPKPRVAPKPAAKPPMVKAATIAPPPGQMARQNAPGQRKKAMGLRSASSIAPGGKKRLAGGVSGQRVVPGAPSLPSRPSAGLRRPLPPTTGGRPQPLAVGDPAGAFQQVSSGTGRVPRK